MSEELAPAREIDLFKWLVSVEVEQLQENLATKVQAMHKFGSSQEAMRVSKKICDYINLCLTSESLELMVREGRECLTEQ